MASSSVDEKDGWPGRRLGLSRTAAGAGAHLSIVGAQSSRARQSRAEQRAAQGNDDIGGLASDGGDKGASQKAKGSSNGGRACESGEWSGVRACGVRGSCCLGGPLALWSLPCPALPLMLRFLPAAASLSL